MKPPMPRRTIPSTPRKKESIITPAIAPNDPNGSDWKLPKARNTGSTDPTKRASPPDTTIARLQVVRSKLLGALFDLFLCRRLPRGGHLGGGCGCLGGSRRHGRLLYGLLCRLRNHARLDNLGGPDLDTGNRLDRLASNRDVLRELAGDHRLHVFSDREVPGRVPHDPLHDLPDHALLRALDPAVRHRHRLPPDLPRVLRRHVERPVRAGPLPAGKSADVVRRHRVAHELREGVLALDVVDLEVELDVHLAEVPREVLDGDLRDPLPELRGVVRDRLAEDLLVEHLRREEVVPALRLPAVLDLAGRCAGLFRLLRHVDSLVGESAI